MTLVDRPADRGQAEGAVEVGAEDGNVAVLDAGVDVGVDVPRDVAMDVARDSGVDAPRDVAMDVARDAGVDAPPVMVPVGPVLYPATRVQSPLTERVALGIRAVAARAVQDTRVFAKVGASNTVNTNFLHCFAGSNIDLAGRTDLRATLDWFRAGRAGTTTPFDRTSVAATVGWSAWSALAGTPSPLQREVDALHPRYAVVMFGTNDIQARNVDRYGQNLLDIADVLTRQGIVPLFTSIPPRDDNADADLWVPRYVAVMRGVAQARQLPFVDLERVLRTLPDHGIGSDGLHMNVYVQGAARGCVLTAAGLRYGFNQRNLLTLDALDRVRGAMNGAAAPDRDEAALHLQGRGSASDPYVVAGFPFTDLRDTRTDGARGIARYSGCNSTADESGSEVVYRVTVRAPTRVRAFVVSRQGVDVDVHLLGATVEGASCVQRNDALITATLAAGTHHFVLDTFVSGGVARAGEYLFVLLQE